MDTFKINKLEIIARLAEGQVEQMSSVDRAEWLEEFLYEDYQGKDQSTILELCKQWGIEINDLMGDAPPPTIADKLENLGCPMTNAHRKIVDEAVAEIRALEKFRQFEQQRKNQ